MLHEGSSLDRMYQAQIAISGREYLPPCGYYFFPDLGASLPARSLSTTPRRSYSSLFAPMDSQIWQLWTQIKERLRTGTSLSLGGTLG